MGINPKKGQTLPLRSGMDAVAQNGQGGHKAWEGSYVPTTHGARGFSPSLVLRILRRDMRGEWRAFIVFVLCVALGISAIMTVDLLVRAIQKSIANDASRMLGGDIEISRYYDPASPEMLAWIKQSAPKVATVVDVRGMAQNPANGQTKAVRTEYVDESYPLYTSLVLVGQPDEASSIAFIKETIHRKADQQSPAMFVSQALSEYLSLKVGDLLTVGDQSFVVAGVIASRSDVEFGPAQFMEPVITSLRFADPGYLKESLPSYNYRMAFDNGDVGAQQWRTAFETAWPDQSNTWRIRDAFDASDRVVRTVETLSYFMTLVGLVSLLLGGVGIANSVRLFLTSRSHSIAVLRVQGASIATVYTVYQLYIAIVGAIGIVIGASVSYLLAELAAPALAAEVFPSLQITFRWESLMTVSLYGILIVAMFSTIPLSHACHQHINQLLRQQAGTALSSGSGVRLWSTVITVACGLALAALAMWVAPNLMFAVWFLIGSSLSYGVFWSLGKLISWAALAVHLPERFYLTRMAIRNLGRPGSITSMVMMSLGLGFTALVLIGQTQDNILGSAMRFDIARTPALYAVSIPPSSRETFQEIVAHWPQIQRVESYPTTRSRITKIKGIPAAQFKTTLTDEQWVLENARVVTWTRGDPADLWPEPLILGSWWDQNYNGPLLVSVDQEIYEAFGLSIGDIIEWDIAGVRIESRVHNVRLIDWATMELDFAFVFSPGDVTQAPQSDIASILVPDDYSDAISKELAKAIPSASILSVRSIVEQASALMDKLVLAIQVMTIFVLAVGVTVLSGVVVATHERRITTAVIMKVLGANRWGITGVMLGEYMILGLVCALVSIVVGATASYGVVSFFLGTSWSIYPTSIWQSLSLAIFVTMGLGSISLWFLLRERPWMHLRND